MAMRFLLLTLFFYALLPVSAVAGPKIVITGVTNEQLSELKAAAPAAELVFVENADEAMQQIGDAEGLMGVLTRDLVKAGEELKWIQVYSAGVDRYRFPELLNSDITLTNCKILQGPNIADHAFALLLPLTRRIPDAMDFQEKEEWGRDHFRTPETRPIELTGKTALIIGLGGIGTQIAQRAHAFGMRVIGVDPKDIPIMSFVEATYRPDELDKLIPEADVIFMSAPHTPKSEKMLGPSQFESMKRGAYFVAVSRGKTYDMNALVKALDEQRLSGAGVDVTDPEPLPSGHALWKFDNVIITPHYAGMSDIVWNRRMAVLKENLRRFTEGRPLIHVVDKQAGY